MENTQQIKDFSGSSLGARSEIQQSMLEDSKKFTLPDEIIDVFSDETLPEWVELRLTALAGIYERANCSADHEVRQYRDPKTGAVSYQIESSEITKHPPRN